MRQLGMLDADFLHKEAAHFESNITLIKIYDQSTAPAGKVRLKSLLAHVESRLDLSPIFRSKLQPTPLGVDLPLWEIYVMEGQDGFHDLPAAVSPFSSRSITPRSMSIEAQTSPRCCTTRRSALRIMDRPRPGFRAPRPAVSPCWRAARSRRSHLPF